MSIALSLPGLALVEEYNGLVEFIVEHLELDEDTTERIPTFIRMAENRLERLLTVPERETVFSAATTSGQQAVALPDGFRQLRTVRLVADDGYPLAPVTLNYLHAQFTDNSGRPQVYAIANGGLQIGPVPDGVYTLSLTYIDKIPALTSANTTNWLLSRHADVYVYSILAQAEAFLGNAQSAAAWTAATDGVIEEINQQGNRFRMAGPIRLRSPVVV